MKSLVRNCYTSCVNHLKHNNPSKQLDMCLDNCYQKYLQTVKVVNEEVQKLGYAKYSIFAYKGYPEHQILTSFYYDLNTMVNFSVAPFAMRYKQGI